MKANRKVREPSRVRQSGTLVFNCVETADPGLARIDALRTIVTAKQYAIIDGVTVDLFTACAVTQVYDALNEGNQEKFRNLALLKMVDITWKLVK